MRVANLRTYSLLSFFLLAIPKPAVAQSTADDLPYRQRESVPVKELWTIISSSEPIGSRATGYTNIRHKYSSYLQQPSRNYLAR